MNRFFSYLIALALLLSPSFPLGAQDGEYSPRLLVHLLDYLAADYGGAVQKGKVVNQGEYDEQVEFSKTILKLSLELPEFKDTDDVREMCGELSTLIQAKADVEKVASLARRIQSRVTELARFPTFPAQWPDLEAGQMLFEANCVKCHGPKGRGDGPAAAELNPKPLDYHDPKMEELAPLQAFNTVRLGVPGTGMAAWPTFSDQETWNLAFYVLSFRYQDAAAEKDDLTHSYYAAHRDLELADPKLLAFLATHADQEVRPKLQGSATERWRKLAGLRTRSKTANARASLEFARFNLEEAIESYAQGRKEAASRSALRAYLEGVEPVEPRLRADDPRSVAELERTMAAVRTAMSERKPLEEVRPLLAPALAALQRAALVLAEQEPSPWLTFTLVLGIILREGLEALLLIAALLGVLRATGSARGAHWIHGGWMTAIGLGILAWFFSGWLLALSGMGREILEGVTGFLTVAILLYVGFWLHNKTEIGRWKIFISGSVRKALEGGNLWKLAFISFLAAFREVLETVLFLRGIWLEGGPGSGLYLGLGTAVAFGLLILSGWALLGLSVRLPIRKLFVFSSVLMVALAFILGGKATHSFQEAAWLPTTPSFLYLRWDWLGLYPTLEVQAVQAAVLALGALLWYLGKRPRKA